MKKKNILQIIFLVVFDLVTLISTIFLFLKCKSHIGEFISNPHIYIKGHWAYQQKLGEAILYIVLMLICITSIVVFSVLTYKHLKGSNASNFVRYTYEEYKAYRAKKKEEKQAKKRAKMEAQRQRLDAELQEMEKTE